MVSRAPPFIASGALVVLGIAYSTWWGPHLLGTNQWQVPDDLWGTLVAASRLAHLDFGGIYSAPTGLVSLPGAAVILVPAVTLIEAAGIGLSLPGATDPHPASWLLAGPYEIAISSAVVFASDAVALRRGATLPRRLVLAGAEALALWSVSVRWGHPEDAVAVALLLYGVLALDDGRKRRSAWLVGMAICVQPLVLLAVPVLIVALGPLEMRSYLFRAAALPGVALVAVLVANWRTAMRAIGDQPNWPTVDHVTPWTSLAPHMSHGAVAAGPARGLAIVVACGCARIAERRRGAMASLEKLLWWGSVALALRSVFEPVMVSYYVWPVIALTMSIATTSWWRLATTSVVGCALTFASQINWESAWGWWSMIVAGIVLSLVCSRIPGAQVDKAPGVGIQGNQDTWPFNTTYPTKAPVSIKL